MDIKGSRVIKVNEIFYSLQGEGFRAGEPSVFIRLTGCDLTCGFCDTEFESGEDIKLKDLCRTVREYGDCRWIVFTGGEPLLQLDEDILQYFKDEGFLIAIETNGNNRVTEEMWELIDWIVVSPKVANHVVEKNFKGILIDEYRLVRHKGHKSLSSPQKLDIRYKYVSPVFDGNKPDAENIKHCINLCLAHPDWRLSLQLHKILNIL